MRSICFVRVLVLSVVGFKPGAIFGGVCAGA
jgi:hypothetical protein